MVRFFPRAATLKYINILYFYMGKGTFAFNANETPYEGLFWVFSFFVFGS